MFEKVGRYVVGDPYTKFKRVQLQPYEIVLINFKNVSWHTFLAKTRTHTVTFGM